MKQNSPLQFSSLVILATVFLGVSLNPIASADPLTDASGKYDGKLSGFAKVPFLGTERLPKTVAILKLPNGKGRVVMKVRGIERSIGKITKNRVRQGGNKVVLIGRTEIPAAITDRVGLSSLTGPFKAVVDLSGTKAKVRATTTVKKLGGIAKGTFTGSQ
jgi:hypothetical protein